MFRLVFTSLTLSCILPSIIVAQLVSDGPMLPSNEVPQSGVGVFGGIAFNRHAVDIPSFFPFVCCPENVQSGSGEGITIGVQYKQAVNDRLYLLGRIAYLTHDVVLVGTTAKPTQVLSELDEIVLTRRQEVAMDIASLTTAVHVGYRVYDELSVQAGLQVDSFTGIDYVYTEKLLSDEYRWVNNPNNERIADKGELSDLLRNDYQYGLVFGIRYEIPLYPAPRLILAPELQYNHYFTDVMPEADWQARSYLAFVSLSYYFD